MKRKIACAALLTLFASAAVAAPADGSATAYGSEEGPDLSLPDVPSSGLGLSFPLDAEEAGEPAGALSIRPEFMTPSTALWGRPDPSDERNLLGESDSGVVGLRISLTF